MFIETHEIETHGDNNITLTFIKSLNVKAYPCGRRRSEKKNGVYIPFDPEARLNTEANNRKHSSINGYTQNYIRKWDEETLSLVLDGYLFDILLDLDPDSDQSLEDAFSSAIISSINDYNTKHSINSSAPNADKIYANIRIEAVKLYQGFEDYYTEVLRNQSDTTDPSTTLDLLATDKDSSDSDSYYFSGLSFSTKRLSPPANSNSEQRVVSLCILEKVGDKWQRYNPSFLPKIEHGEDDNSVKLNTLLADKLKQNDKSVPSMTLENQGNKVYKMCFSSVDIDKE